MFVAESGRLNGEGVHETFELTILEINCSQHNECCSERKKEIYHKIIFIYIYFKSVDLEISEKSFLCINALDFVPTRVFFPLRNDSFYCQNLGNYGVIMNLCSVSLASVFTRCLLF